MNYQQMTKQQLRSALKKEIKSFESLPRRDSFSALGISGKINRIQHEMFRRNMEWEEYISEVTINIG